MSGSPKNEDKTGLGGSPASVRAVLGEIADQNAEARAIGERSGTAAVAALDGFATGDALRVALDRWHRRTEEVDRAVADASTALDVGRPDPAA
ncbi:hypothetical protein ACIBJD_13175 [Kitasatospora sp. NPDC050467]|uniref:hypothetical protein n=1 Tax=Kitasatospora sp. NPDC050467 TaxID=3364053 RepID=UPI0037BA7A53